jgi:hypothetical protein
VPHLFLRHSRGSTDPFAASPRRRQALVGAQGPEADEGPGQQWWLYADPDSWYRAQSMGQQIRGLEARRTQVD